jgi:hypothetical protein
LIASIFNSSTVPREREGEIPMCESITGNFAEYRLSLSLDDIFDKNSVIEVVEKLTIATSDKNRIKVIEQFFCIST